MESEEKRREIARQRAEYIKSRINLGYTDPNKDPEYLKRQEEANLSQTQTENGGSEEIPVTESEDQGETGAFFPRIYNGRRINQPTVTQGVLPIDENAGPQDRIMSTGGGTRKLKIPTPIERQFLRRKRSAEGNAPLDDSSSREEDRLANRQRWAIKRNTDPKK